MIKSSYLLFVCVGAFVANLSTSDAQQKVLSPSIDKPTNQRIQDATAGQSVDPALTVNDDAQRIEPSQALLRALETMIPRDVTGTDVEPPILEIANQFLAGDFQTAFAQLNRLGEQYNDLPPSSLMMAGMYFTAGNSAQARAWMEKASLDFPEYPTIYTGFARIAINENRITDAIALLEKGKRAIDEGNWNKRQAKLFRTEYLDGLTDVAINRQQLDQARDYLLELQTMLPQNARVPLRLAQVEFDLDNLESSLRHLEKTRELAPNLRRPEVIISDWLLRKNKLEESKHWIETASRQFPDDRNVQLDYGKWLLRNEQLPQALEAIQKAEQLGADNYVVTFLKGQVFFARRAYDVAQMHFQRLNQMRPGDGDSANMLALSLIESNETADQNKAIELATMNQRLYPRSPTAMATLGWVNYRLGRMADSENAFKQITTAQNLEPAAAYFVANYLDQLGNTQTAIELLNRALNADTYFMYRSSAKELLNKLEAKAKQEAGESGGANDSKKQSGDGKSGDGL